MEPNRLRPPQVLFDKHFHRHWLVQQLCATPISPSNGTGTNDPAAINIATDIIFASLPIPMFYNIKVNKRTKASLMMILSLSYLCGLAPVTTSYVDR